MITQAAVRRDAPAAWSLLGVPARARAGRRTQVVRGPACASCGGSAPALATDLEVVLQDWRGEQLFSAGPYLLVTARLAAAIERAGLTGCALHPVQLRPRRPGSSSGSSMGVIGSSAGSSTGELPELRELVIVAGCRGPSGWWRRGPPCPACGRPAWEDDPGLALNRNAALAGRPAAPREVWRSTWHGLDLAQPDDPGPPVVSARARALLEGLTSGLLFLPVALVDPPPAAAPRRSDAHLKRIRAGLRDHEVERETELSRKREATAERELVASESPAL